MSPAGDVDAYIAAFPEPVREILENLRQTIRAAAPGATEAIRYGIPAYVQGRVLVQFGAFKRHIGLFPPVREPALQAKVAPYRGEKGNLRFPLSEPIPYGLVGEIVRGRVGTPQKE